MLKCHELDFKYSSWIQNENSNRMMATKCKNFYKLNYFMKIFFKGGRHCFKKCPKIKTLLKLWTHFGHTLDTSLDTLWNSVSPLIFQFYWNDLKKFSINSTLRPGHFKFPSLGSPKNSKNLKCPCLSQLPLMT